MTDRILSSTPSIRTSMWDRVSTPLMSPTPGQLGNPFADALPTGETPKVPRDDPILEGFMRMKKVSAEQVPMIVESDGPARASSPGTLEFVTDEGQRSAGSSEESLIAEQRRDISNRYGGQIARLLVVEKDYLRVDIPTPNIFI